MNVDVAIIGAGTAGLNARRAALKEGASIVMIESGPYGTTCARVGCMPSKLLIHPAEVAHTVHEGDFFGVHVNDVTIDTKEVLRRVRAERDRFVGFVQESVENIPAEQKLRGHARFIDDHTLDVDGTKVTAKSIVIATGSSTWIPPVLRDLGDLLLTNDEIFEQEDLPSSVAVLGLGVIGLELGQAMHRLGSNVAFFDPTPGFAFLSDPEILATVDAELRKELHIFASSTVHSAEVVDGGVRITWTDKAGQDHEKIFEKVLAAAGRRPNTANLGLENTTLELDERGFPKHIDNRTAQIGDHPIFIAGDASAHRPLLHEAADEGRIAGLNAANYPMVRAQERRAGLAIVFSDPNIAVVGDRYDALTRDRIEVGEVDYHNQGRSRVMGKNQGKVRIYATRACGVLVGAEMFGPRVENTAHLLAWAIQQRMTVKEALKMPFYHPVVEEGIRTALRDLENNLKFSELPCDGDELRYGVGV